jgi:hypothetical protein
MKGKKAYVANLMTLTGTVDDQMPLDDAHEPVDAQRSIEGGSPTIDEAQLLRGWMKFCRTYGLDASDELLQAKYLPALKQLLIGGGGPDAGVAALHQISDLVAAHRCTELRKPGVPLRAGGDHEPFSLDDGTLRRFFPTLWSLGRNGNHR